MRGGVFVEKYRIDLPIIVEGKYDKNTLSQIFDATVIYIGGFSVFNSKEKQALLRKIAVNGVIILTDSDGGGKQIRSFLNGILPKDKIFNAYVPRIEGKERRKKSPSRSGLLGVEGMDREVLLKALAPFVVNPTRAEFSAGKEREMITKLDFYNAGFSGSHNAAERRGRLARHFDLPEDMTANALVEALNIITDREGYLAAVKTIDDATD